MKAGDKVKLPINKTSIMGFRWEGSTLKDYIPDGQDFAYVVRIADAVVGLAEGPDNGARSSYIESDLELYETPLPQKWVIERTKENYREINKWANSNPSGYEAGDGGYDDDHGYIHSEAIMLDRSFARRVSYSKPLEGFTPITIEQFRQIIGQPLMNKKVTGYKLLKDAPEIKAGTVGTPDRDNEDVIRFESLDNHFQDKDHYEEGSYYTRQFCQEHPDWFQPVYEEEIKRAALRFGNPVKEAVITSKGEITVGSYQFTPEDLNSLMKQLGKSLVIGKEGSLLNVYTKKLWIGCADEGTEVAVADLSDLLTVYDKLNGK